MRCRLKRTDPLNLERMNFGLIQWTSTGKTRQNLVNGTSIGHLSSNIFRIMLYRLEKQQCNDWISHLNIPSWTIDLVCRVYEYDRVRSMNICHVSHFSNKRLCPLRKIIMGKIFDLKIWVLKCVLDHSKSIPTKNIENFSFIRVKFLSKLITPPFWIKHRTTLIPRRDWFIFQKKFQ